MQTFTPNAYRDSFPAFAAMRDEARPFHYLDNGASTLVAQPVIDAMATHDTALRANVHRSVHYWAEQATQAYEGARDRLANYFGAARDEIIITSGTTHALNIAAYGLADGLSDGDEILLATDNHHAHIVPWQIHAAPKGALIKPIPLTDDGRLTPDNLLALLSKKTRIVGLSHISNVTGAMIDLQQIGDLIRAAAPKARIVVDGAQSAAHWPLYGKGLAALPIDFYACSAHKMHGPTGVGMLWGRSDILEQMPPLLGGGEMIRTVSFSGTEFATAPTRFEAGTPPITQAVGFGAAISFLSQIDHAAAQGHTIKLAQQFADVAQHFTTILGAPPLSSRSGPIISFTVPGCHPHDLCQLVDRQGVALRGGHHCAQPLMAHFGILASTRASFAAYNTEADLTTALNALESAIRLLKG